MAWPPPVLPVNRTNSTAQLDTHPADHNAVNLAVNDIVSRLVAQGAPVALRLNGAAATTDKIMIQAKRQVITTAADGTFNAIYDTGYRAGTQPVCVVNESHEGAYVCTPRILNPTYAACIARTLTTGAPLANGTIFVLWSAVGVLT